MRRLFKTRWFKITHLPFVVTQPRSHVTVFYTFVKEGQ